MYSGFVASSYMIITAQNNFSSASVNLTIDNGSPSLTPQAQLTRLCIALVIVSICVIAVIGYACWKYNKTRNESEDGEKGIGLIEHKFDDEVEGFDTERKISDITPRVSFVL
jgi:hypothetical protein